MNPSDESDSRNSRPSRLDAISIPVRNKSNFRHAGEDTTSRSLPRRGRRKSDYTARQSSPEDDIGDALQRPSLGRSKSLDFPETMVLARHGGARNVPERTKSLDFSEVLMRSINRRRIERKLHLADSCTKLGGGMDGITKAQQYSPRKHSRSKPSGHSRSRSGGNTRSKPSGHSRSKSGGLDDFVRTPDLFSVSERPDAEECAEEQDTPNVIVFRRRRSSLRSNTWLV
jgi:hypothetical protein